MIVRPVHNTIMNSVTYILYQEGAHECVLVDCGEFETLQPVLRELDLVPRAVLLTHGHSDHIYGLVKLLDEYPDVVISGSEYGFEMLADSRKNLSLYHGTPFEICPRNKEVVGSGVVNACGMEVLPISTPGHNPSCISYRIDKYLFTGDSYLPGIKVVTNLPKANKEQAKESETLLKQIEMDGYIVMPGHHSYL